MESGLLPSAPAAMADVSSEIDGRGWVMVVIAMVLIGFWSLRASPQPTEPRRISHAESQMWMADALPGVGVKTREQHWQKIRAGDLVGLPERARGIARQVFIWPEEVQFRIHSNNSFQQ
jgi:hypothetical protein